MSKEPETLAELHAAETAASQAAEKTEPAEKTEETTPEPAEAATIVESETDEKADSDTEESEEEESIRGWMTKELGYDASHYTSDEEAIKGLVEKARLAGRRDEDAEYGKTIRQLAKGRESEVLAFLKGETQPTKEPEKATKTNDGVPEYDPAWRYQITTDEKTGEYVPAKGAPKDVVEKLRTYMEWRERRLDELARSPDKYITEALKAKEAEIEKKTQAVVEQVLSRNQLAGTLQSWESENKSILYVNGKDQTGGLTPIGNEIVKIDAELANDGMQNPITRLNRAKEIAVLKHQGVTPAAKKLPSKVIRKPAIAPSRAHAEKTVDDLFNEEGADLLTVFTKLQAQKT